MSPLTIVLVQLVLPSLLGLAVTLFLRQALYRLLCDLCHTAERARFWERVIGVLMLAAPLVWVLWFGSTRPEDLVALVRQTMALSLTGVVLAVLMVAWQLGRHIPRPEAPLPEACATMMDSHALQ